MSSSRALIPFVKASACGNDFLIIDGQYAGSDPNSLARRICDRHHGIGADGVEWLYPSSGADIEARLVNADGSPAEVSGNGTRCVAAYLCSDLCSARSRGEITVATGAGVKSCQLTARKDSSYEFETDMGRAEVRAELCLRLGARQVRGIPVSMGNPHYVVLGNEVSGRWREEAAEIQQHPAFPSGVNVEWVTVLNPHDIAVCFFERGVGETQSSGTGSCASAVASIEAGRATSPVRVHASGGVQTVRWDEEVYLSGAAELIGRGEFFI
jgi:diaminopimelate epimerase